MNCVNLARLGHWGLVGSCHEGYFWGLPSWELANIFTLPYLALFRSHSFFYGLVLGFRAVWLRTVMCEL